MSSWQYMLTAPKDRVVMLWVPEFTGFPAGAWFGRWNYNRQSWDIRTPLLNGDRQMYINDLPPPTHWQPYPEKPDER